MNTKKKIKMRVLCLFLCLVIAVGLMPMTALAKEIDKLPTFTTQPSDGTAKRTSEYEFSWNTSITPSKVSLEVKVPNTSTWYEDPTAEIDVSSDKGKLVYLSDQLCKDNKSAYRIKAVVGVEEIYSNTFNVTWTGPFIVTVNNGTGAGEYDVGASVEIKADAAPSGKRFIEWEGVDSLTFTEGSSVSASAVFQMPSKDVKLTAVYGDYIRIGEVTAASPNGDITPVYGELATRPVLTVTTGNPVYFPELMYRWYKYDSDNEKWINVPENDTFGEGTYRYEAQMKIDEPDSETYILSEEDLHVEVDGKAWTVGEVRVWDTCSLTFITSPEFAITKPEGPELIFRDDGSFDIGVNYVGREITSFSVAENVDGGIAPYTFSKVSGPDWITISGDGDILGTPVEIGDNADLVVKVIDSNAPATEKTITIAVAETKRNPNDREVVSEVEAESEKGNIAPVYGEALEYLKLTVATGEPAYFAGSMYRWKKCNGDSWSYVSEDEVFGEGTYRYEAQLRIDGDSGITHMLAETGLKIQVDGIEWTVGDVYVGDTYSYVTVHSPEFSKLVFHDDDSLDIGPNYVNRAITSFSVAGNVNGGKTPYTFSKVSGPDWITVSEDGGISGTPGKTGTNADLVVKVKDNDSSAEEETIIIAVADTTLHPDDRKVVSTVTAKSPKGNIAPVYGKAAEYPLLTVTMGEPAYFTNSMYRWQKYNDESWSDVLRSEVLDEGTYRYGAQLRIDGDSGITHMLAKSGLKLQVDGKEWNVDSVHVFDTYSYVAVYSPEFIVEETCKHVKWDAATCITSKTCSACGETEGDPLGHEMISYEVDSVKYYECRTCKKVFKDSAGTIETTKPTKIPSTAVKLNTTTHTMNAGTTYTLKATMTPSTSTDKITWSSSSTKIATVSADGIVKAIGKGKATITAKTASGKKATCKITVNLPAASVTLNNTSLVLNVGKTSTLKATLGPKGSNDSVVWSSSNNSIATVSNKGAVKAVGKGTATITAKTGSGKKATCKVTVNVPATSVKLNVTKYIMNAGTTYNLTATMNPASSNDTIAWSSSSTKVATVSADGVVKAIGKGKATITAKTGSGKKATCKITVNVPATGVKLNATSYTLNAGKSYNLKATLSPGTSNDTITWSSSNNSIATVSNKGAVKAVGKGTATITAKTGSGKTAICKITVMVPAKSVKLSESKYTMNAGAKHTLKATMNPTGTTDTITWTSTDSKVAKVSSGGVVTAVGKGTATITAKTTSGKKATCKITVKVP